MNAVAEDCVVFAQRSYEAGQYRAAWRAYLRAARLGDSGAQLNLGVMYSDGKGVDRNGAKARYWYLKALGDVGAAASAANNLAVSHLERKSYRRARRWFERAVALGSDDSRLRLGQLLLSVYGDAERAQAEFALLEASESACAASREAARTWRATVESILATPPGGGLSA